MCWWHCVVVDLVEEFVDEGGSRSFHELTNRIVISLFHTRMWQSWYSEVDVNLV